MIALYEVMVQRLWTLYETYDDILAVLNLGKVLSMSSDSTNLKTWNFSIRNLINTAITQLRSAPMAGMLGVRTQAGSGSSESS